MKNRLIVLALAAAVSGCLGIATPTASAAETQYLLFQTASSAPAVAGQPATIPVKGDIEKPVRDIVSAIGSRGDYHQHQLGFTIGPLMFDLTDDQTRAYIDDAFKVAEENDVAVAFHIDDSMFWNNRKDLWSDHDNVEWRDWQGGVVPHRIIGWVLDGRPVLAPPICYNSPAIIAEARRRAGDVIGREIKKNLDRLIAAGKPYLFAGVIAGWETRLQDDSHPAVFYGYCALHNLGYSATQPPADIDQTLAGVVRDWVKLWTRNLRDAGIPRERIYTHNGMPFADAPVSVRNPIRDFYKDAPPGITAFTDDSYPGFTHGAGPEGLGQIHKLLGSRNNLPWGISEGTAGPGLETYLAQAFNHGATFVNVFGWSREPNPLSELTTAPGSIAIYRKFLEGEPLQEVAPSSGFSPAAAGQALFEKLKEIQRSAPSWLAQHPEWQPKFTSLLQQLDRFIRGGQADKAEQSADEVLKLIGK